MTFKENCPDSRNTKVIDLVKELQNFACKVSIFDPLADKKDIKRTFKIELAEKYDFKKFDVLVLAVPHDEFLQDFDSYVSTLNSKHLIYDLKGILPEKYKAIRL